jgi:hypothetical protein
MDFPSVMQEALTVTDLQQTRDEVARRPNTYIDSVAELLEDVQAKRPSGRIEQNCLE